MFLVLLLLLIGNMYNVQTFRCHLVQSVLGSNESCIVTWRGSGSSGGRDTKDIRSARRATQPPSEADGCRRPLTKRPAATDIRPRSGPVWRAAGSHEQFDTGGQVDTRSERRRTGRTAPQ